eukprot:NODE_1091_length_678_cov_509.839428_g851_i0.p1 GENE.NODE_1091_length_678_cov_509.839428_g851_i0~~NODE_1091_length_678_cov_509.839428_g851_i0.p1  ORF type:complete len:108 (-),score=20.26 NODE_1091_length_678_cov_509.839428_g851_i0:353-652(-)
MGADSVCVSNDAGFDLEFFLSNDRGDKSMWSGIYPIDQRRCIPIKDVVGVKTNDTIYTTVKSIGDGTHDCDPVLSYYDGQGPRDYTVKGVTIDWSCNLK